MEDINTPINNTPNNTPNNEPKEVATETVTSYKDVVVNVDKQDAENKFSGMKDLFTSIISENRKDYDKQITEMRGLFMTVLEENRKQGQLQVQDMYKTLPSLINEADKMRRKEEYVFLNDEDGLDKGTKSGKYTRMSAIKELIVGKDTKNIQERLTILEAEVEETILQDKESLAQAAKDIYDRLERMENRIKSELDKTFEMIKVEIQTEDKNLAIREEMSKNLRMMADQTKGYKQFFEVKA